jgi:hypothetical protein
MLARMKTHAKNARRHPAPWITLLAGLVLAAFPLFDPRPGLQAWSCLSAGALFSISALVVLVVNPTWGVRIDGDTLKWWHDGRGEERTVSLTELCAVRVDREADVAALESTSGIHVVVPRECLANSAQAWALELHQRYPHIEFHVS